VGSSTAVSVTVTDLNGFNQPVQLSCSGLPTDAACGFGTSLIAGSGGTTTLQISAAAPHNCGSNTPYFVAGFGRTWVGVVAGVVLACFGWKRRWLKGLVPVLVAVLLLGLSGCGGNCTDLGTKPGTYSFTVTGTSTGSPMVVHSQAMTMTVKI